MFTAWTEITHSGSLIMLDSNVQEVYLLYRVRQFLCTYL